MHLSMFFGYLVKNASKVQILFVIFVLCVLSACVKEKNFPEEPYLEYRSQQFSTKGEYLLTFYFQDGDGDLGLATGDTFSPYVGEYRYNIYFIPFEKKNDSVYDTLRALKPPYNIVRYGYRILPIEQVNSNKNLRGEIQWTMQDFPRLQQEFRGKTVRFEVSLYDRALHPSNVIYSPDIHL